MQGAEDKRGTGVGRSQCLFAKRVMVQVDRPCLSAGPCRATHKVIHVNGDGINYKINSDGY